MMAQFQEYAGTPAAVQRVARNIVISSGGRTQNLSDEGAEDFIHDVDETINSKLSSVYVTPLRKIARDGEQFYPHPIPNLARRMAAAYMVQSIYSEIDQNVTAAAEKFGAQAVAELEALAFGIVRGSRRLQGQFDMAKNNFANPRVLPRENMPSPRQIL